MLPLQRLTSSDIYITWYIVFTQTKLSLCKFSTIGLRGNTFFSYFHPVAINLRILRIPTCIFVNSYFIYFFQLGHVLSYFSVDFPRDFLLICNAAIVVLFIVPPTPKIWDRYYRVVSPGLSSTPCLVWPPNPFRSLGRHLTAI